MKIKDSILYINNLIYSSPNIDYVEISDEEYYKSFGLKFRKGKWKIKNKNKIEAAYKWACENRDFEINKFWTRTAYFWGFIVLIFGLYFNYLSKEDGDEFIQLHIICTGIIFSTA
jgi:hypothetical protein